MGKASQQRRSRQRMTLFNISKSNKETETQQSKILKLENELSLQKSKFEKVEIERFELSRHMESLEHQVTLLKKGLEDKEKAVNTANCKITSLEKDNFNIEDKLNSYRGTLRKLIIEKEEKTRVEDKEKQK